MGTSISSLSTSNTPTFSGTSTFASDLQQVITRATSIASLPIQQLSNNISTLTSEQSALSSLSSSFASLQTAVARVNTAAASGNFSVSYSTNGVATAIPTRGALIGQYNLTVIDPGSQSSAVSTSTVTDPATQSISTSAIFTLTANGQTYANIVPPPDANTMTGLVTAINTATQGAVQATIVNVGTPSEPAYQLSILNTAYGALDINLTDSDGTSLLGTPTDATSVQYTINGQGPLTSDTRHLTIAPNLTVTVLGGGSTSITVGQSTTNLASAITNFVSSYNSAARALGGQRGQNGGALIGQSVVATLTRSLQSLAHYSGTGSVQSLADLGLTFEDNTGQLSFDSSKLTSLATSNYAGVMDFLGTPTTGGFLQAATNALKSVLDPTTGAIPTELTTLSGEITDTSNKISEDQDRVNQLQANLAAQMTAADTLIAQMQSQASYLMTMFNAQTANQNQIANG